MNCTFEIRVQLRCSPDTIIWPESPLEVSLDCPLCRRCRRTVVFRFGEEQKPDNPGVYYAAPNPVALNTFCTPKRHEFQGLIEWHKVNVHSHTFSLFQSEEVCKNQPLSQFIYSHQLLRKYLLPSVEIVFRVRYKFASFFDEKYQQPATATPSWGRINFGVQCPTCLKKTSAATQTNLVRPCGRKCECGTMLYVDDEPPEFVLIES